METSKFGEEAVCDLSSWFYRRMAMLTALVAGLGLYFLYDGAVGYPKKNFNVDLYEAFEAGRTGAGTPDEPGEGKLYSEEQLSELGRAGTAGKDGGTWAGFAAERLMSEKVPERYTGADIREQFICAAAMGVVVVIIGIFLLWKRGRFFRYGSDSLVTPSGETILFEKVSRIDLEKWDRGMGKIHYENADGEECVQKVDDYKFNNCGKMLKLVVEKNDSVVLDGDERWLNPPAPVSSAPGEASEEVV